MKSFITSLCVLAVMITGIVIHSAVCLNITEKLDLALADDSIMTADGSESAHTLWEKNKMLLHLGVNMQYTDRISEVFITLRKSIEQEEKESATESVALLRYYISEMKKLNGLSPENFL